jgi:prevent-host-death family protein
MLTWPLQDAKSRFSERVDRTLSEGPQLVTRRGVDAVVVLAAPDCRRLAGQDSLLFPLLHAPRGEPLDVERSNDLIRPIEL